tara:strand:+ start:262 stop:540 length:279 start_codon:yes stop_codon:yes gene_type:complete
MNNEKKIEELEQRHEAFMKYDGQDVMSLVLHATELQQDMIKSLKRLSEAFVIAVRHVGWNHSQDNLWYTLDALGMNDLYDFDADYSEWEGDE